jgi:DNA-binding CsgD family transcriptional regulator
MEALQLSLTSTKMAPSTSSPATKHLNSIGQEYRLFGLMFDELDHGVMLLDAACCLHYANSWANQILEHGHVLREVGLKVIPVANCRAVWDAGFVAAQQGERRLVFLGSGTQAVSVALLPLDSYLREASQGLFLAIFGKRSLCESLTLLAFARAFRLTNSEQAVLTQLCNGQAPGEVAKHMSLAESTVRSHVKSILAKTAAPSIRDLLITLTKLPPMLPRIKPAHWPGGFSSI